MKLLHPRLTPLAAALLALAPGARAVDVEYRVKAGATALAEDLPTGPGRSEDTQRVFLDATPWLHLQFSPDWAAFLRARAFLPSDDTRLPGNDDNRVTAGAEAFVGLKEAWVEYGGLTSYPGEVLRLGRQRLRQDDAQWWDADIDALRWRFDTTLLQADLGVARQFHSYRSDDPPLPPEQEDRTYVFGALSSEWRPTHRLGLRVVHGADDNELPDPGSVPGADTERERDRLTWLGLTADNHAYDGPEAPPLAYWASWTWLRGEQRVAAVDATTGAVTGESEDDVHARAAELGLRGRLPGEWPLQFGAAYSISSGSDGRRYQQTGLQSNVSRFTGTRALINRTTDAYRAQLGNLEVATAFTALSRGAWDVSAVYNHFERRDGSVPVVTDAFPLAPVNGSTDLGDGYDLVLSRYFSLGSVVPAFASEQDPDSSLRLRGSLFSPGEAYGDDIDDAWRVGLELTLWY